MVLEGLKHAAEEALRKARGTVDQAREALPDMPKDLPEIPSAKDVAAKLEEGRERAEEIIERIHLPKADKELPAPPAAEDLAAKAEGQRESAAQVIAAAEPPTAEHPAAG